MNFKYAAVAQRMLKCLIDVDASNKKIGLLTFYKTHWQIHENMFSFTINVMTVNVCQKHQFDYVILSTVTPNEKNYSLEFLADSKKINVAFSKAKHELITSEINIWKKIFMQITEQRFGIK